MVPGTVHEMKIAQNILNVTTVLKMTPPPPLTTALQQSLHVDSVRCRAGFRRLISMIVSDIV